MATERRQSIALSNDSEDATRVTTRSPRLIAVRAGYGDTLPGGQDGDSAAVTQRQVGHAPFQAGVAPAGSGTSKAFSRKEMRV
jgi:hypothetical protein